MLTIADPDRYARHRTARVSDGTMNRMLPELLLSMALFGCIGSIAWAIRGTNGWNGIDGTIIPGMMWGILWWYCCARKGIQANSSALWLGLGIAVGGELGYGIYVSWIRGFFMQDSSGEMISVVPGIGWLWFFICGIGWGAPGGICLGWAISTKRSLSIWIPRILIPYAAYHSGAWLVDTFPQTFLPNYDVVDYSDQSNSMIGRIIWTQTLNTKVLCAWLAAMWVAIVQRDKSSYMINGIIGGGFGFGFAISAIWCLGYGSESYAQSIDWWKVWELNAGLFLGALYALALWWSIRDLDKRYTPEGMPLSEDDFTHPAGVWNLRTTFEAGGVIILTMTIYYEDSFRTSVAMSALFAIPTALLIMQSLNGLKPQECDLRRAQLAQAFCVFLFLFVTWHGATSTLGIHLGRHTEKMVDQYSWPIERQWLFAPLGIVFYAGTVFHMFRTLRGSKPIYVKSFSTYIYFCIVGLYGTGMISIWPSIIHYFYTILLCATLFTYTQLNKTYSLTDDQGINS